MRSMPFRRSMGLAFALGVIVALWAGGASSAAPDSNYKTADGLAVYIGVVPAEVVKGHPPSHPEARMHDGVPAGQNEYHVVVALFDSASGARITNATVEARISGLGLAGPTMRLATMNIADTITYGGYFRAAGRDLYRIRLTVRRPGTQRPAVVEFNYDLRR